MLSTKLPTHDLADCERLYGFICETCAQWYNDQTDEWALTKDERVGHDT